MTGDAQAITDYAASLFLRYFRSGQLANASAFKADLRRDLALLRSQWAVSKPVRDFLRYVLTHPHETQCLLMFKRSVHNGIARGRIDARASALRRLTSGFPSAFVVNEPVRSFDTGPNHLVAWVVRHAALHASKLLDQQPSQSGYRDVIEPVMVELAAVERLDALREPLNSVSAARQPSGGAIRDAARSRRPLYGHAVAAYRALRDLETGDQDALLGIIQSTLIAPVEIWRRFELAVVVGIGQAIADVTNVPMRLNIIADGTNLPIIECGRYGIYWQHVTRYYNRPVPEPSEWTAKVALAAYGIGSSSDRPDLVIVDEQAERALGIVEVKYLEDNSVNSRFRDAMNQIVRYSRGYGDTAEIKGLIRRSLIVMNGRVPKVLDSSALAPTAMDFSAILKDGLSTWVTSRLLDSS